MFEGILNKIILFLIFVSVFVNSLVLTTDPADIYIGYVIFIVLLPVFIVKHTFPKNILMVFSLLLAVGIFNIIMENDTVSLFLKVFLGLFFSYLFYYFVVLQFGFDIERLFQLYLKGCYIVSIIGLIQFSSYHIGFEPGYDFSWIFNKWGVTPGGNFGIRVNSIFGEPTYFGTCVSAGMFVSLFNLFGKQTYFLSRVQSVVILVAYGLTFSGVAYMAILVALILLLINYGFIRYVFFFVPVFLVVFFYMYNNVRDFRERYDGTIDVFTTGHFMIGRTHGSSIILYNNYHIAMENFSRNFLFGTGLGSHPVAFDRFSITKNIEQYGFNNNSADANSMLLRLISETGIFGTSLMLLIFFKCFIKRSSKGGYPDYFWIISCAIFVMIFVNLFRQGHYFLNGFPLFIWMYYYNYVNYRNYLSVEAEKAHASVPGLPAAL